MIKKIQQLFSAHPTANHEADTSKKVRLACAALLVEVMVIDQHIDASEEHAVIKQLTTHFGISENESIELLALARQEVHEATSLYQFTHLINKQFNDKEKYQLVRQLWHVAYADENLDKHEEATIRRIAELIHLPHSQYIRAKQKVKSSSE